jgi:hypothetical protein
LWLGIGIPQRIAFQYLESEVLPMQVCMGG